MSLPVGTMGGPSPAILGAPVHLTGSGWPLLPTLHCPSLETQASSPLFSPHLPPFVLGVQSDLRPPCPARLGALPGPHGEGAEPEKQAFPTSVKPAPHTTPPLLWGRVENRMEDLELPPPKLNPVLPQHAPHRQGRPRLPFSLPSPFCLLRSPLALA